MGHLCLNIRGRYLRQQLLAQALHMVRCRPDIMVLAESQSRQGEEEPPFEGYTCHVHVGAGGAGKAIDVYVSEVWRGVVWCGGGAGRGVAWCGVA